MEKYHRTLNTVHDSWLWGRCLSFPPFACYLCCINANKQKLNWVTAWRGWVHTWWDCSWKPGDRWTNENGKVERGRKKRIDESGEREQTILFFFFYLHPLQGGHVLLHGEGKHRVLRESRQPWKTRIAAISNHNCGKLAYYVMYRKVYKKPCCQQEIA